MSSSINKLQSLALGMLSQPVLIIDKTLSPVYCNSAFLSMVDCEDSSLKGLSEIMPELCIDLLKKESFSTSLYSYDGSSFQINVEVQDVDDKHKLLTFRKYTLSNDSLHSQRLETLGMLAGGVAHDFNNILAGILGHSSYLKNILPESGEHKASLEAIEEGGQKASEITQEILSFSRLKTGQENSAVELASIIERSIHLLKGALYPKSEIKFTEKEKYIKVYGSEVNISQILVNLFINAHDAIQESGRKENIIKAELGTCTDSKRLVEIFGSEALLSEYAEISIIDSGVGMSKETLQRVFEPYFSTKADHGTGLGLATVAAIVKNIGGAIDIRSRVGKGTIVSVFLPLILDMEDHIEEDPVHKIEAADGKKKILIIDDEEVIRSVLTLNLKQIGYDVSSVASGPDALKLINEEKQNYDLILLDMLMPQMSGEEVFDSIIKIKPDQKFILISGYCAQETIDSLLEKGAKGFLSKPFGIEELAEKVADNV